MAAVSAELRFGQVSFSYGTVPALRDVSFALAPGERAALSAALDLPGRPVRERDVAHTLARVAAATGRV